MRDVLAAALSGALLLAAAPPLDLTPLIFVALVPLLAAARAAANVVRACGLGWRAGAVVHAGLFAWLPATLRRAQGLPWPAAMALFAAFVAFHALQFALAAAGARLGRSAAARVAACTAAWVLLEWGFPKVFPWSLGAGLGPHPLLRQAADLGGAYGLAAEVLVVNALLAEALLTWAPRPLRAGIALAGAGVVLGTAATYGVWHRNAADSVGDAVRVAAVQPGDGGASPAPAAERAWARLARLSVAPAVRADAVVWPESAWPVYVRDAPFWRDRVETLARDLDSVVVAGALDRVAGGGDRTAAYVFAPALVGVAAKAELVPFGEYLPEWLPLGSAWRPIAPRHPGSSPAVIDAGGIPLAIRICFEAIRPGAFNAAVRAGAALLLNPSDDGWFASPWAAAQHGEMVRLRAVETRRWLVRASGSGISAAIDPRGAIVAALPFGARGVIDRRVTLETGLTPYARWGDAPLLAASGALLLWGAAPRARH
ncbi:MAG: apolipoprotein N-acyltransferase [Candidatus Binatia bacterium]